MFLFYCSQKGAVYIQKQHKQIIAERPGLVRFGMRGEAQSCPLPLMSANISIASRALLRVRVEIALALQKRLMLLLLVRTPRLRNLDER